MQAVGISTASLLRMTLKIAIVGAGPSGLTCARRLAAAGTAVTVFEKGRGVGGRCATRRSDVGPFHHGAPSFTARSTPFRGRSRVQAGGGLAAALLQAFSATFAATPPLPPPSHAVAHRWRHVQVTAPVVPAP